MALNYQSHGLVAATANRYAKQSSAVDGMVKTLALQQEKADAEEKRLIQNSNLFTKDFYNQYSKLEQSTSDAWNTAATEWVHKAATDESKLYMEAYGENGTTEKRNELNALRLKHSQALKTIGQWMVTSNMTNKDLMKNNIATDAGVMENRTVRGGDNDLMSMQIGMSENKYKSFAFAMDEGGNILLNGVMKGEGEDAEDIPTSRNLQADVANSAAGNNRYQTITKDDLLTKTLGDRWNDTKNGLALDFKPTQRTRTTYNDEETEKYTSTVNEHDPAEVKSKLLTDYSASLDQDIKTSNFPQTWDQLYNGGFIKDAAGNQLEEGKIAWNTVGKVQNMNIAEFKKFVGDDIEQYDVGEKGIDEEDQQAFIDRMNDAARNGLANYYSEVLAPQRDEVVKTTTTEIKQGSENGYTPKFREQANLKRDQYNNIHSQMQELAQVTNVSDRANGIASVLNKERTNKETKFYTGYQIQRLPNNQDWNPRSHGGGDAIYEYVPGSSVRPKLVMDPEKVASDDIFTLEHAIMDAGGIDKNNRIYLQNSAIPTSESYATQAEAEAAYGAGNVVANPDGTFGKK